jgi:hypothetical protein
VGAVLMLLLCSAEGKDTSSAQLAASLQAAQALEPWLG